MRHNWMVAGAALLVLGGCASGNKLVGRWRDTFTDLQHVGYEGPFTLTRRAETESS